MYGPESIAACFVEPIAGSTGTLVPPKGYLEKIRATCDKYGIVLIFDEVITGFGRTGSLFASQALNILPDILCVGKALGGGLPLSACIGDIVGEWEISKGEARHTSTFLGHPLGCELAYRTVKAII